MIVDWQAKHLKKAGEDMRICTWCLVLLLAVFHLKLRRELHPAGAPQPDQHNSCLRLEPCILDAWWRLRWCLTAEGFPVSGWVSAPISHLTLPLASPAPSLWNGTLKCDGYSGLTFALEDDSLCFHTHTHTHSWYCGQFFPDDFLSLSLCNTLTNNTTSNSHIIPHSWSEFDGAFMCLNGFVCVCVCV